MLLVSFGLADTTVTINVSIFDDDLVENNEVFQILIDISPEFGIMKGTPHIADAIIIDDDSKLLHLNIFACCCEMKMIV